MADSGALRVRRSRLHKAGDHSLCRRCAAVRGGEVPPRGLTSVPDGEEGREGRVLPAFDAAAELRHLAERMITAHEADPSNAILGAELRKTLAEIIGKRTEKPDDDLAGLFGALGSA